MKMDKDGMVYLRECDRLRGRVKDLILALKEAVDLLNSSGYCSTEHFIKLIKKEANRKDRRWQR